MNVALGKYFGINFFDISVIDGSSNIHSNENNNKQQPENSKFHFFPILSKWKIIMILNTQTLTYVDITYVSIDRYQNGKLIICN